MRLIGFGPFLPRPVLVTPARSMPPTRDQRKPLVASARGPLVVPEFTEAGVVLSYPFWIRRFQGDRAIAGRTVTLNGVAFTITGVASASFVGTANPPEIPDVWAPIEDVPEFHANLLVSWQ